MVTRRAGTVCTIEKRRAKLKIYEELQARGLLAQVTNEEEIREMLITARPPFTLVLTVRQTV